MDHTNLTLPPQYVITIGRTFGSGGRALGRLIADRLGIAYYDKELLTQAARKSGMSDSYVSEHDERAPSFLGGNLAPGLNLAALNWFGGHTTPPDTLYMTQCELFHDLAKKGPCVIVGRSSDHLLRDLPCLVNVFLHAPIEHCVKRILDRNESADPAKARSLAEKHNKLRAAFYNFYTDKRWGDARSYHLTFDSSQLPLEDIADMVIDYLYRRYGRNA